MQPSAKGNKNNLKIEMEERERLALKTRLDILWNRNVRRKLSNGKAARRHRASYMDSVDGSISFEKFRRLTSDCGWSLRVSVNSGLLLAIRDYPTLALLTLRCVRELRILN